MGVFEFIIIIVIITTLGKVAMAVGGPLVDKLGDIAGEMASSRRVDSSASSTALESDAIEELERRLARIEDRLDFLEELRAPEKRRALGGGLGLDRGAGPRGRMQPGTGPRTEPGTEPGTEPEPGRSPTDERTTEEP